MFYFSFYCGQGELRETTSVLSMGQYRGYTLCHTFHRVCYTGDITLFSCLLHKGDKPYLSSCLLTGEITLTFRSARYAREITVYLLFVLPVVSHHQLLPVNAHPFQLLGQLVKVVTQVLTLYLLIHQVLQSPKQKHISQHLHLFFNSYKQLGDFLFLHGMQKSLIIMGQTL